MCKAINYRRWSDPVQGEGDSNRRQDENYLRFCAYHKLTPSTMTFVDAGISAWSGDNLEGALGSILEAIKIGTIKEGYCVVIEQLDRLSRLDLDIALPIFGKILRSGVSIGHVRKNRILTKADLKGFAVTEFAIELILGAEESTKKSERVKAALSQAQVEAKKGKIWTSKGPAWLKLSEDRQSWIVLEKEASKVRMIYEWCISGLGVEAIVKRLIAEGVKPLPKSKTWTRNYVLGILRDKIALGYYQPTEMTGKYSRKPVGQPIANYYTPIISEETYYKAQAALDSRIRHRGRVSKSVNVLGGLVLDGVSKSKLYVAQRKGYKVLFPSASITGESGYWSVRLDYVEQAVLSCVWDLRLAENESPDKKTLAGLVAKKETLEGRIAKAKAQAASVEDFDALLDVIRTLEVSLKETLGAIETLEAKLATTPNDALSDCKAAIAALQSLDNQHARLHLRAKLQELIDNVVAYKDGAEIYLALTFKDGSERLATINVEAQTIALYHYPDLSEDRHFPKVVEGHRQMALRGFDLAVLYEDITECPLYRRKRR